MKYSPCVGICTATAFGDEICRGCKRTFDEVRDWNTLTPEQRATIMRRLKNERLQSQQIISW